MKLLQKLGPCEIRRFKFFEIKLLLWPKSSWGHLQVFGIKLASGLVIDEYGLKRMFMGSNPCLT